MICTWIHPLFLTRVPTMCLGGPLGTCGDQCEAEIEWLANLEGCLQVAGRSFGVKPLMQASVANTLALARQEQLPTLKAWCWLWGSWGDPELNSYVKSKQVCCFVCMVMYDHTLWFDLDSSYDHWLFEDLWNKLFKVEPVEGRLQLRCFQAPGFSNEVCAHIAWNCNVLRLHPIISGSQP